MMPADLVLSLAGRQLLLSTLVCALVLAVTWPLRGRWSGLHHGLWLLVLARLLLPPDLAAPWSLRAGLDALLGAGEPGGVALLGELTTGPPPGVGAAGGGGQRLGSAADLLLLAWLAGTALFGLRYAAASRRLSRALAAAPEVASPRAQALAERWRRALRIRRRVRVVTSADLAQPLTAGLFRPVIHLPTVLLAEEHAEHLEPVLAHEMAHVRRFDALWIRLLAALRSVYFFHPVVWLATSRLEDAREAMCDEMVLAHGGMAPRRYGRSLLAVLQLPKTAGEAPAPVPALGNTHRRLKMRIENILRHRPGSLGRRLASWAAVAACALLLLPMAASGGEKSEAPGGDREAQARTIQDLREVGTALMSWLTDQVSAGAAGEDAFSLEPYSVVSHEEVEKLLVPLYIESVPATDGWGHPYELRVNVDNVLAANVLAIRSPGRDGIYSGDDYEVGAFPAFTAFDEDLVWADGYFIRWPGKPDGQ